MCMCSRQVKTLGKLSLPNVLTSLVCISMSKLFHPGKLRLYGLLSWCSAQTLNWVPQGSHKHRGPKSSKFYDSFIYNPILFQGVARIRKLGATRVPQAPRLEIIEIQRFCYRKPMLFQGVARIGKSGHGGPHGLHSNKWTTFS